MQSILFDDGYKEFSINNDESKVIRFSPTDYSIIDRFSKARKAILEALNNLEKEEVNLSQYGTPMDELEQAGEMVSKVNNIIFENIDYIFDYKVSQIVFGNQSPISTIKGKFLFERFLDSVSPIITKEIEAEHKASTKRIQKYTSQVK